jgi:hypothetical protein
VHILFLRLNIEPDCKVNENKNLKGLVCVKSKPILYESLAILKTKCKLKPVFLNYKIYSWI